MRRAVAAGITVLGLMLVCPAAVPQGKATRKAAANPPAVVDYAQRYAEQCAACHGATGRGELPDVPVLAGQHSYYAVTQLFLFREGRRGKEAMIAVAKTLKDDDLRGYSDFIGTLPPLPAPPPAAPIDAARMARGEVLAQQNKCLFCHGTDLSGGQQVPRIAGQREAYLRESLQGFQSGKRVGYTPAMLEPVRPLSSEDLDTLAYYAANLAGGSPKPAAK